MQSSFQSRMKAIIAHSSPSLSDQNIERGKILGKGKFGVVQQIVSKETFALKQIDLKPLIDNIDKEEELCEELTSAFSEFQIMKRNYPNVVRSYQCHFDKEENVFSFTMDLMKGKDLGSRIQKNIIPFEKFYQFFQNIVTGKNYSHILHFANGEKTKFFFF